MVACAQLRAGNDTVECGAVEQRDEADEGRVEAERGMVRASRHGSTATKDHGGVVRPSQLIASVRQARAGGEHEERPGARGLATDSTA